MAQYSISETAIIPLNVLDSSKMKQDQRNRDSSELPYSTDQEQGSSDRSLTVSALSHCRQGRQKGSGKRLNLKVKTKSPDFKEVKAQRLVGEILEVELCPHNGKPKEDKGSEQILIRDLKKKSRASCDKLSKTMDKFIIGSPKISTKFHSPSSKSKSVSLKNKVISYAGHLMTDVSDTTN